MCRLLIVAAICVAAAGPPTKTVSHTSDKSSLGAQAAPESIDVQYCRAQLQLAEANLARVQSMNRKVARSVPASIVAEQQHDVAIARLRLRQAETAGQADEFSVWLERAQADYREAQSRWKNAVAVNAQSAGTFKPEDIERFRLRGEVYRLQVARGQSLVKAPREEQLAWRVELLNNELKRVKEDALRIAPMVPRAYNHYFYYPLWW